MNETQWSGQHYIVSKGCTIFAKEMENMGKERRWTKGLKYCRVLGVSLPQSIVNVEHMHTPNKPIYANKGFGFFFFFKDEDYEN